MPVTSIDPNSVRQSETSQKKVVSNAPGFSETLSNMNPAASAVAGYSQGYQAAAVTSASITGVAGASNTVAGNSPYYSTPLAQGASVPAMQVATTGAGINYNFPYPTGGVTGTSPFPTGTGVPGVPSQDYQEKQALFQQMNDANWEMLVAQVNVNNISRDYQARSNILKTKSDTELNAVRNMRA